MASLFLCLLGCKLCFHTCPPGVPTGISRSQRTGQLPLVQKSVIPRVLRM